MGTEERRRAAFVVVVGLVVLQFRGTFVDENLPRILQSAHAHLDLGDLRTLQGEEEVFETPWYVNLTASLSRVWPTVNHHEWCIPQTITYETFRKKFPGPSVGLVYTKCPKSSSSTGAGVTLRIAHKVAERELNKTDDSGKIIPCTTNHSHRFAFFKRHQDRVKETSLLWTTIRHPANQTISMFFHFLHGRQGRNASDSNILDFANNVKSMQTKYNSKKPLLVRCSSKGDDIIQKKICFVHQMKNLIFDHYDFLAVTERLDESLVVMKNLWGLELGDLLKSSTKVGGTYETMNSSQCQLIPKSFVSPGVDEYFKEGAHAMDNLDYLLYAAAVESLDQTIDALGRERIAEDVRQYRKLQRMVDEDCKDRTFFKCSSDGVLQLEKNQGNCYSGDMGCGFECMDYIWQRERPRITLEEETHITVSI